MALLALVGPVLLLLFVLGLDVFGQCHENASLALLCESATLAALFAVLPATIGGLSLLLRKRVPWRLRLGAGLVLLLYGTFLLYGDRLLNR